ncbi:MAG: tetratricopeptide repeat protein, partial [Candidatus Cloacimonetes bacterium]|nr:tetratricopeptide repeat protein [Candidatus Cloacimonadota bacterium]
MAKYFSFLIILTLLAGCSVNKITQQEPSEANIVSANYFSFAEAALQQKDIKTAIDLYKKADEADSNNVYIKEKLLEILSIGALFNPEYQDEITKLGEKYYSRKLYSEKILSIIAETYRTQGNFEKAKKFYKRAIKVKPTVRNLTTYYIFQKQNDPPADPDLLERALEFPWKNKEQILRITELIGEYDIQKSLKILEKVYGIWDDEKSLTSLLTTYEKAEKPDKVLELLQQRINEKKSLSDPLKTFLIGKYYTLKQYDKVLENQELCFKVGKSQILKFLFFAAIQLEKFETGIKTGHAIEKAEDLTDEFKPSFYAYFAKLFFSTGENEKAVDYLTKANDVHIIRNLIYEYDFDKDEDIRKRILNLLSSLLEKTENKDLANFLLGIVHTRLEDNDIATEYMNEISDDFLEENDLLFIAASIYLQNSLDIKKAQSLLEKLEQEELTPNEIIAGLLFSTENDSISYFMLKTEIIENPKPHISTFIRYSILAERFNTIDSLIILLE